MPVETEDVYDFDQTHMGGVKVRVRRYKKFDVEDLVEARARGLATSLRLEQRRQQLAKGNPALQEISFAPEVV